MGLWSRLFGGPCSSCEALEARSCELEARLFAEINSNRLRESELLASALRAAGIQGLPGARTALSSGRVQQVRPLPVEAEPDDEPVDPVLEQQIQDVAEQMIAAGRAIGNEYTEEAQLLLLAKIRENPERYLS